MTPSIVMRMRAFFGLGFIGLGVVVLWRLAGAAGPGSKVMGGALGAVMIALGVTRLIAFLRWQRGSSP
jgi:hypothetical protein